MQNQLGPLEVVCDAPPYLIVRACHRIGLRMPEDVRWCRMSHFLNEQPGWRETLKQQPWKILWGASRPDGKVCTCGQHLPRLEKYTFTLSTGHETSYFLGQCERCRSIFWEDA
jgi:hypothetical protein